MKSRIKTVITKQKAQVETNYEKKVITTGHMDHKIIQDKTKAQTNLINNDEVVVQNKKIKNIRKPKIKDEELNKTLESESLNFSFSESAQDWTQDMIKIKGCTVKFIQNELITPELKDTFFKPYSTNQKAARGINNVKNITFYSELTDKEINPQEKLDEL